MNTVSKNYWRAPWCSSNVVKPALHERRHVESTKKELNFSKPSTVLLLKLHTAYSWLRCHKHCQASWRDQNVLKLTQSTWFNTKVQDGTTKLINFSIWVCGDVNIPTERCDVQEFDDIQLFHLCPTVSLKTLIYCKADGSKRTQPHTSGTTKNYIYNISKVFLWNELSILKIISSFMSFTRLQRLQCNSNET